MLHVLPVVGRSFVARLGTGLGITIGSYWGVEETPEPSQKKRLQALPKHFIKSLGGASFTNLF